MRRIIALLGVCGAILVNQGCSHVGGKCDCGPDPVPGSCNYYNTNVTGGANIVAPASITPAPAKATPSGYEEILPPKDLNK
ncbi:hypothetical protein KIH39_17010 [Telmatocola sphagniphila]|jgi:hypothetical protein|uniref:Uncharacterized protein n=1 Tax=Telmatocola sphagniphila TaxID=1123043 RepID=A0A8E6B531_9BACT|nr:hypothetical protein [Telmatocola sphagniphila]QVL30545.1 hypothetical protein KIH39_17010 [Telmatocola sphagniphila]